MGFRAARSNLVRWAGRSSGLFPGRVRERRKWLDEAHYLDIVALCQFLPGPASSQTGITIGILRAGLRGGLAAWVGVSGPSALAMILFGYGVGALGDIAHVPWLHGLKIVAVAVVRPYGEWRKISVQTDFERQPRSVRPSLHLGSHRRSGDRRDRRPTAFALARPVAILASERSVPPMAPQLAPAG